MINLEIINTHNPDRLGKYPFYFNSITIGNHITDNVFLEDEHLIKSHITISIEQNKLYVIPDNDVAQIHVNNKICTAKKLIQKNDVILIGSSEIKIGDFSLTEYENKKDFLKQRVEELPQKHPELIDILQELAK